MELTRADRKHLEEITSLPWPNTTSLPAAGPVETASDEQLSDLLNSYLPLEHQLAAASELGRRQVSEGHYRNAAWIYPCMSDEQLRHRALDTSLAEGQWDIAGIARRFLEDDPAELARFAAISVRTEWILAGHGREACSGQGHTALWALAVGDSLVLDRFLTTLPFPLDDPDPAHPPYYLQMCNAIFGVLRGERETARHSVEQLRSRKLPAHEAALVICLRGILEESPETVARGLGSLGPAVRRIRAIPPHHKLIDVTLHGAYELCRRVDPTLVRLWDTAQTLPWDRALYEWRRTDRDPLEGVDFTGLPERLRILLTELPEPDWWPAVASTPSRGPNLP